MPSLRIPERHRPALEKLATLSEESIQSLISALYEEPDSIINIEKILEGVASKVDGVNPDDVQEIVTTLFSLANFREFSSVNSTQLIDLLHEELLSFLPEIPPERQVSLKEHLTKILDIDNILGIASQAISLNDYENIYLNSRVVTNVRPLFRETTQELAGVMVSHVLKIAYRTTSEEQEFFVFLDDNDLQQLRQAIEVAEQRAKKTKATFSKKDIAFFNVD